MIITDNMKDGRNCISYAISADADLPEPQHGTHPMPLNELLGYYEEVPLEMPLLLVAPPTRGTVN